MYLSKDVEIEGNSFRIFASEVIKGTPNSWASAMNSQSYAEQREFAVKLSTSDEATSYSPPCIKNSASCMS